MELFDVINEQDQVISQANRDECHHNPALLHRAVHFTLIDTMNRQVLLSIRNPALKYDGGKTCFMGEHVKAGENWLSAVKRGFKEELTYPPKAIQLIASHIFAYASQRELVQFFVGEFKGGTLQPDPAEIIKTTWVPWSALYKRNLNFSEMTSYWINHPNFVALGLDKSGKCR